VALKPVGGGNRYEVWLVWDEGLFALGIAKPLRPDQAADEKALRDLQREVEVLEALAHPTLIRSFDAELEGPYPHVLIASRGSFPAEPCSTWPTRAMSISTSSQTTS
jgi:eukaryotic-like serine/threonine-protein kinase